MPHTSSEIIKNWLNPEFKFFINREGAIKERTNFLMQNQRMRDEYLGACLDYIRWGGQDTVMYEMGTKKLIGFIMHWKSLNEGNLIWHQNPLPKKFDLPRTDSNVVILSLEKILDRLNLEKGPDFCPSSLLEIGRPCRRLDELPEKERKNYKKSGCLGHPVSQTVHPFDGWYLAWYVQKWHEQVRDGKAPVFKNQ